MYQIRCYDPTNGNNGSGNRMGLSSNTCNGFEAANINCNSLGICGWKDAPTSVMRGFPSLVCFGIWFHVGDCSDTEILPNDGKFCLPHEGLLLLTISGA